jgi:pyruvate,water dikinase
MVYARGGGTTNLKVPEAQRRRFCLTDGEVLKLAADAIKIEEHYSKVAGRRMPMDIEWAKDGTDGNLYIIQARPETVVSRRAPATFETYALGASGEILVSGRAVGEKIASGPVRTIASARELG